MNLNTFRALLSTLPKSKMDEWHDEIAGLAARSKSLAVRAGYALALDEAGDRKPAPA